MVNPALTARVQAPFQSLVDKLATISVKVSRVSPQRNSISALLFTNYSGFSKATLILPTSKKTASASGMSGLMKMVSSALFMGNNGDAGKAMTVKLSIKSKTSSMV